MGLFEKSDKISEAPHYPCIKFYRPFFGFTDPMSPVHKPLRTSQTHVKNTWKDSKTLQPKAR